MILRKAVIFSACLLINLTIVSQVKAEEVNVEISGNSSGSSNEVHIEASNNLSVNQNNSANINNNVVVNTNTGNNSATSNANSDSVVSTGSVDTTTIVNNQNINSNQVNSNNCNCSYGINSIISGNAAGSDNGSFINHVNSVNAAQANRAYISNNVNVNGNTGDNSASFNGGNSTIITGNIKAKTTVSNRNVNNSFNSIDSSTGTSSVVILSNGSNSENSSIITNNNEVDIEVLNIAEILNTIDHDLNTGGNSTLANLGDSVIITGDIQSDITVENENINSSIVNVDCECETPEQPEQPSSPTQPQNPSTGTSIVQGSSGSAGSSNTPGANLPRTGLTIPLTFVATIIFIFMFLTGLYLRFYSSKSPPAII